MQEIRKFPLYGRECRLSVNDIFGNGLNVTVRLGYFDGEKWVYIYSEEINQVKAEEGADAELERILVILNKKANELWADDTPEPQQGINRIIWLIENRVYVENNEIKVQR